MDYRAELDKALSENARIGATLGIDSTNSEKEAVRRQQYKNLLFLKDVDKERFESLTGNFERKYRKFEVQDSEEVDKSQP